MILVIHAHPYPHQSRGTAALLGALEGRAGLEVRKLYDLYPDFDIDVWTEQRALEQAQVVVWMHPVFWYSVPALLKHWIDKVLAYGWAYGEGGTALHGKHCLWVPTTGGDEETYTQDGMHGHPFTAYVPVIEQTARFCGMRWEAPEVIYDAGSMDAARTAQHVATLLRRLQPWQAQPSATAIGARQ